MLAKILLNTKKLREIADNESQYKDMLDVVNVLISKVNIDMRQAYSNIPDLDVILELVKEE